MKKEQVRYPSIEALEKAQKTVRDVYNREPSEELLRSIQRTKRTRIELVEDRYTGTLYEMEVEDEDDICPVIKEARK